MANPFPFTAGQILTAAQLNGIGESVSFTPTYAASTYTRGNGTVVAFYVRVQKLVYVWVVETLGSTSSVGASGITMNLPLTAANLNSVQNSPVLISDFGSSNYWGIVAGGSTTTVSAYLQATNGAYSTLASINATTPMTWTTNDIFGLNFVYEAA